MSKQAAPPDDARAASGSAFHEHLASVIHDEALQSIGASMLQVDLCRGLLSPQQLGRLGPELDNLQDALEAAAEALRHVTRDLWRGGPNGGCRPVPPIPAHRAVRR